MTRPTRYENVIRRLKKEQGDAPLAEVPLHVEKAHGVRREKLAGVGSCFGEGSALGGSLVHEGLQELERHHPPYLLYKKGPYTKEISDLREHEIE